MSRRDDFEVAMSRLLMEYADILAPTRCGVCPRGECHHEPSDGTAEPVPNLFPGEWIVVHQWMAIEGGGFWDWQSPSNMLMSHAVGLLTATKNDAESRLMRAPA